MADSIEEKEKKVIIIKFKSLEDFRLRFARLFQDQKEDESYEFKFPDKETEAEFVKMENIFRDLNEV